MSFRWLISGYTAAVIVSSIVFRQSESPQLLILLGLLYVVSHSIEKKIFSNGYLQFMLLVAIHWYSGTDWSLTLYMAQLGRSFNHMRSYGQAASISTLFILAYGVIVFEHDRVESVQETPILFHILYYSVTFFILALFLFKYMRTSQHQTVTLNREKERLITHDSLTGLINFEECHRQLEKMVHDGRPIIFVLLDCRDLKSLNSSTGFQGVNLLLKQVAQLLGIMFPDALFTARYGGDEFAVALQMDDHEETYTHISGKLGSEFPKLTGIQITYGIAAYPYEASTKDDLISIAEKKLFMMKRDAWLKQEEHMLRSEKLKVVGELASGMAHEIRNPLTTVKGFLQLAKANGYNVRQWYELIMMEIDRMSMLTGEFLQFSKPHPKEFQIHTLQECVARVLSLMESETARLGHQLRTELPEQPVHMWMDPDKILQLLLNLVKNAYEAMSTEGVVLIRVSVERDQAVMEVRDNGNGMTPEELEQIFTPFYTTKESGTGLGLAICHKIIQDHKGRLEVESVKHAGTTFTISFPLAESAAVQEKTPT
ncbi:ATP-binding protein [Paenibacillus hamazuiensis]|uniref:ATP-binding protein n=1 Tax=Paenibacillus hamazuiensis TaxID=2936508 RepID=UPI00200D0E4F|nr:ATP-binding protein [Paenibacillus hamazuiensis]